MKKFVILSAVLSLAVFILLPGSSNGKYNVSKPLVADGSPLPWPPFPPGGGTLVADGSPLPWPPFPSGSGTLIADGSPLPWPPFPPGSGTTLA
jgi:hypothetical protein